MLDEGCNSCTHSRIWRQDAQRKFANLGLRMHQLDSDPTNFNGIAGTTSSGKWVCPIGMCMQPSEEIIPGVLTSHEMDGPDKDFPLLLSKPFQQKLGFVKDMRAGICLSLIHI